MNNLKHNKVLYDIDNVTRNIYFKILKDIVVTEKKNKTKLLKFI